MVATNPLLRTLHANRGMILPVGCVLLLMAMLLPLPTGLVDLLLVLNIAISVIVLITTMHVRAPLELAVFPSLLLAVTLLRLVLNVATTRLILSADRFADPVAAQRAAGDVVHAFSNFVAGEKLVIGAIIFLIIFVIQFVVITRGCGRISEVAARFVLDAMPGKQMAIDADLSSGAINDTEAKRRREELSQQADFYGAMDGASKFVRGDAVAGVIITLINILGGLYIGMIEMGWSAGDSTRLFTRLTIGDGLVSQIPAFIIALSAGIIVTRSSGRTDLGDQVIGQVLGRPKVLYIAAAFLVLLAPSGLPALPLLIMAALCAELGYMVQREQEEDETVEEPAPVPSPPEQVERHLGVDALEVEIGPGLIRVADVARGGDLIERIGAMRRDVAADLGIIVPPVRVHDQPDMPVNDYVVKIKGHRVASGVTYPEQFLAVDRGSASAPLADAEETVEPGTAALAYWITESQLDEARAHGYEPVEAAQVIVAHLAHVIRAHAHELLSRQEVRNLLEVLKQRYPALVEEVVPAQLKPAELQKVLQNLLRERVSVRDLETILEALSEAAGETRDIDTLTECARLALARSICRQYADENNRLRCLTLDPALEDRIGVQFKSDAALADVLAEQVREKAHWDSATGRCAVVLCDGSIRRRVRKLLDRVPEVAVMSLAEVTEDVSLDHVGCIQLESDMEVAGTDARD